MTIQESRKLGRTFKQAACPCRVQRNERSGQRTHNFWWKQDGHHPETGVGRVEKMVSKREAERAAGAVWAKGTGEDSVPPLSLGDEKKLLVPAKTFH
jgi:hypothetical protein